MYPGWYTRHIYRGGIPGHIHPVHTLGGYTTLYTPWEATPPCTHPGRHITRVLPLREAYNPGITLREAIPPCVHPPGRLYHPVYTYQGGIYTTVGTPLLALKLGQPPSATFCSFSSLFCSFCTVSPQPMGFTWGLKEVQNGEKRGELGE